MVEILAYAFGIMYTPGPVNLLSLNAGINGQKRSAVYFCLGVSCAMLLLFLIFSYGGSWLLNAHYQWIISLCGTCYIFYLALKIAKAGMGPERNNAKQVALKKNKGNDQELNFKSGLLLQLLNPKSFIVILPIATIQFPAAEITGAYILLWSLLLSALAFGAPNCYMLIGSRLGGLVHDPRYFRWLNSSMALLLFYVATDIAYHHVYLTWPTELSIS